MVNEDFFFNGFEINYHNLYFSFEGLKSYSIFTLNLYDTLYNIGYISTNLTKQTQFPYNMTGWFSLKLIITIGLLILIRGGTPRYRYDFLTKLGWLKFIGLIIWLFWAGILPINFNN